MKPYSALAVPPLFLGLIFVVSRSSAVILCSHTHLLAYGLREMGWGCVSCNGLKLQLIEETQKKERVPLATTVWNSAEDKGLRQANLR